ncbi:MAG: metallophosphoesterase [Clostridia bacterium]|nr:metallophosphoesterase [Clostridia bacterium]
MTYAISDLHGYPLESFLALLEVVGFSDEDTLYIIGDVIDRNGDGGVAMLRYIMEQPNFEFLLGNHEDMLLACDFLFDEITEESIDALGPEKAKALERYLRNGGGVTLRSLRELERREPGAIRDTLQFLRDAPVVGAVTVNGRDFLLVHGGLPGFSPDKKLKDYDEFGLLWERPALDAEYFDDVTTVFGHTPTLYYGEEHRGRIIRTRTWINIDAGAAEKLPPALLRLDDLEVFYGD